MDTPAITPLIPVAQTESAALAGCGSDLARQLYPAIAEQPFFTGLRVHQLQVLADSAMGMEFRPEEIIFREGEPANRFYLILSGKVALESAVRDGEDITVQTLGPGESLGWSWLFPPYHMGFTARALEPVKTIFFYGTRLQQQCDEDHELGYELMKRIAAALIKSLQARPRA